jgi:hypothetical protein
LNEGGVIDKKRNIVYTVAAMNRTQKERYLVNNIEKLGHLQKERVMTVIYYLDGCDVLHQNNNGCYLFFKDIADRTIDFIYDIVKKQTTIVN